MVNAPLPSRPVNGKIKEIPAHKKDEAKVVFIGTLVLGAFRMMTAPIRWVWNTTIGRAANYFTLKGRVKKAETEDDVRFREAARRAMGGNGSGDASKEGSVSATGKDGHLPVSSRPISDSALQYAPLEDPHFEGLRTSLDNLAKIASETFYDEKAEPFIKLAEEKIFPESKKITPFFKMLDEFISPEHLALNTPVIHLLLDGKGPSLEERKERVNAPELNEESILNAEHLAMRDSLKGVYTFLLEGADLDNCVKEKEEAKDLYKKRTGHPPSDVDVEDCLEITKQWLREGIGGDQPFASYAKELNSDVDMRLIADVYPLVTRRLLINKAEELTEDRIPALGHNLSQNLKEMLNNVVPKVADHVVLQGIGILSNAPTARIIDDAVISFYTFLDASLKAKDNKEFAVEFLCALREKNLDYDPATAKTGLTEEWVRTKICEPLRNLMLGDLNSDDKENRINALGSVLSRIADEIKLPSEFYELLTFGRQLARGFKPSDYCTFRLQEYGQKVVFSTIAQVAKEQGFLEKDANFADIWSKLQQQGPNAYNAFKLFALEEIFDRILARVITPRIHKSFKPEKIEMLLGSQILPEVNESLMQTYIKMVLAHSSNPDLYENIKEIITNSDAPLSNSCLDRIAACVYKQMKAESVIGKGGYLSSRYSPEECPELYRKKLKGIIEMSLQIVAEGEETDPVKAIQTAADCQAMHEYTDEELAPYKDLLNTAIMEAAGYNQRGNLITKYAYNLAVPMLINKVLAPVILDSLHDYRINSQKIASDLSTLIHEKSFALLNSKPLENEEGALCGLSSEKHVNEEEPIKFNAESFLPSFESECDMLASISYDMATFQARRVKGGMMALKHLLGEDQKELVNMIYSVAIPILKRPLAAELMISHAAQRSIGHLQEAQASSVQPRFSRNCS